MPALTARKFGMIQRIRLVCCSSGPIRLEVLLAAEVLCLPSGASGKSEVATICRVEAEAGKETSTSALAGVQPNPQIK